MNDRIKEIIPDPPEDYQAYLYIWRIWIEEKRLWKYYVGRKHDKYHLTRYWHSSKTNDVFKDDLARREKIEYEILQYGDHISMAIAEIKMLVEADNGKGAADSELYYNRSNGDGGGLYAKGLNSHVHLDGLYVLTQELLDNHKDIEVGETKNGIQKVFVSKKELKDFLDLIQFLQTRNERFDTDHVDNLKENMNEDPNPDEWEPIIILQDAKIENNKVVPCKGSQVIIGGNHRTRANVGADEGIGLNAFVIPYSMWKVLKGVDFRTFSNRFNPVPKDQSKGQDPDSAAQWIYDFCYQKKITKKSEDGVKDIPDYLHVLVANELKLLNIKGRKLNTTHTKVQQLIENAKLRLSEDNLIDFSNDGLANDPALKKTYDKRVKIALQEYDWVYKVSAEMFGLKKIIEPIRKSKYKTKGFVYVQFKTLDQYNGSGYKKLKAQWEKDTENLFKDDFDITIKELPITLTQAKLEGWIDESE